MIELIGKSLPEVQHILIEAGFEKFRARQLFDYIYKRHVFSFADMNQLPAALRQWLEENCSAYISPVVSEKTAPDGNTTKLLIRLQDGSEVETVLMKQEYGNSVCVSSQVGCAMGCVFCASTQGGLYRNLEVNEIVLQVLLFARLTGERIHSLVVMGAGEPLHNYENVVAALRFIHDPDTFDMGYRRMTVSTCGIVEGIRRLAEEGMPITLALSLHAPNDNIRHQLMPISRQYRLEEVIAAMTDYYRKTERRITFEYILIDKVNASDKEARELGHLTKNFPKCNVNLIPVNGNEHIDMRQPSRRQTEQFRKIVESYGTSVTVRREMGDAIQAACGQLKVQHGRQQATGEEL